MKRYLIICIFLIVSCGTKKTTISDSHIRTEAKADTVIIKEVVTKYLGSTDTLVIENPCDSLGNLQPFKHTATNGSGKVGLQSDGNDLKLNFDFKDLEFLNRDYTRISDININDSRSSATEIVKTKWSKWQYILLVVAILSLGLNIRNLLK